VVRCFSNNPRMLRKGPCIRVTRRFFAMCTYSTPLSGAEHAAWLRTLAQRRS
jgi:hypothetical protein